MGGACANKISFAKSRLMQLTCRLLFASFHLKRFLMLGVRRRDGNKRKPRLRGNQDIPWPPQEPQQVNGQVGTFPPAPPGSRLAPSNITKQSISPPPNISAFQITLCCLMFMAFYTQKSLRVHFHLPEESCLHQVAN